MRRPRNPTRAQLGLTLVELMVVMVIVGVLATLAVVMVDGKEAIGSIATKMGGQLGEASRVAVSRGPVVASVTGNEGFTARARFTIDVDSDGTSFAVDVRQEDDNLNSSWVELSRRYIPSHISVSGVTMGTAQTEPGGVPSPLPADFEILCEPSGQCQTGTIFLEDVDGRRFRVVVMPLSAAPLIYKGW